MTPGERVRGAMRMLGEEYVNPNRLTIHMHPAMVVEALLDDTLRFAIGATHYKGPGDVLQAIWGLPVVKDNTLPEDGIVLRYEVVA